MKALKRFKMLIRAVFFLAVLIAMAKSKGFEHYTKVQEVFKVESKINIDSQHESVTDAVKEIIKTFFLPKTSILDIITSSSNVKSRRAMEDIISETLQDTLGEVLVSLHDIENYVQSKRLGRKKVFNIFYVDSYAAFKRIFLRLLPEEFNYQGYYLIVITEKSLKQYNEIKSMMNDLWSLYIVNVNVIYVTHSNRQVSLMMTFYPFTDSHCEKVFPVSQNTYILHRGFVRDTDHFPNKLANLHGCPLSVATFNSPPFVIVARNESTAVHHFYKIYDSKVITGFDGVLIKVLSRRMNFTLKYEVLTETLWGLIDEAGNNTGAISMVMSGKGER